VLAAWWFPSIDDRVMRVRAVNAAIVRKTPNPEGTPSSGQTDIWKPRVSVALMSGASPE
jgi:hypothetical protein